MGDQPYDSQATLAPDAGNGQTGRALLLLVAALAFAAAAYFAPLPLHRWVALGVGAVLLLAAGWLWTTGHLKVLRVRRRLEDVMLFVEHDSAVAFCTDPTGAIVVQNKVAARRFAAVQGDVLSRVLEPLFANPDGVVHRLRTTTQREGSAREDIVTRRGHVRVSVTQLPGGELWRLEDLVDRPQRTGDGLSLPMLTASASGTILFMNESLRQALGRRAKRLADIFDDMPLRNGGIHHLRTRESTQQVRVAVSRPVADRKEIFIFPVEDVPKMQVDGSLNGLLNTLPIALVQIDRNGMVTSLNRAALKLLPRGDDGPVPLASLVEGLGRSVSDWVAEAIQGRGLYKPEVVHVAGAGEVYLQITLGRPLDPSQDGLIAVLNDATELKSIEAQFVQSQKMQAIGQLAGGVAHDFNNLLTAISGHCDLLLLRRDEDDPDYADLNQINQNTNRAAALVGQLLAFSRKQTLKMQDLDLRDTLGDMTHLLNRLLGERVRLVVEHDPALIPIRGDRRQLEQVLMNLVVNARDAMPDGGEVRIETQCEYLEAGKSRDQVTMPPGQYVVIRVTDQGCGIEPGMIGRIFDPFVSTKRPGEGTGLGLSMAYGIVKQSGGYIFADSEPGQGAKFSLYFPAGRSLQPAAEPHRAEEADQAPGLSTPAWVSASARSLPAPSAAAGTVDRADAGAPTLPPDPGTGAPPEGENATQAVGLDASPVELDDQRPRAEADGRAPPAADGPTETGAPPPDMAANVDADPLAAPDPAMAAPPDRGVDPRVAREAAPGPDNGVAQPSGPEPEHDVDALIFKVSTALSDPEPERAALGLDPERSDAAAPVLSPGPASGVVGFERGPGQDAPPRARTGTPPVPEQAAAEAQARTVLLVEDEAPVRAFASRALRLKGYTVVEAACAEDALQTLDDAGLKVDLFVTDVMMPGLDGPTWVRKALERRPDVRTIFVSGYTQNSMSETSTPVPNSYFLPKPFSLADLTQTVQRALQ